MNATVSSLVLKNVNVYQLPKKILDKYIKNVF